MKSAPRSRTRDKENFRLRLFPLLRKSITPFSFANKKAPCASIPQTSLQQVRRNPIAIRQFLLGRQRHIRRKNSRTEVRLKFFPKGLSPVGIRHFDFHPLPLSPKSSSSRIRIHQTLRLQKSNRILNRSRSGTHRLHQNSYRRQPIAILMRHFQKGFDNLVFHFSFPSPKPFLEVAKLEPHFKMGNAINPKWTTGFLPTIQTQAKISSREP